MFPSSEANIATNRPLCFHLSLFKWLYLWMQVSKWDVVKFNVFRTNYSIMKMIKVVQVQYRPKLLKKVGNFLLVSYWKYSVNQKLNWEAIHWNRLLMSEDAALWMWSLINLTFVLDPDHHAWFCPIDFVKSENQGWWWGTSTFDIQILAFPHFTELLAGYRTSNCHKWGVILKHKTPNLSDNS